MADNDPIYVTFEFRGDLAEEVERVTLGIKGLRNEAADTYRRLIADSTSAFNAMEGGQREVAVAVQEGIVRLRELATVQRALDVELADGSITSAQYARASAAISAEEARLREEVSEGTRALQERSRSQRAAADSMTEMGRRLRELTDAYMSMGKAEREGESGRRTLERINLLSGEMDAAQRRLSASARSVGGQYDALGMSVQQVARELPSLTMGANMFFLAISNNLPMLADNIRSARMEYDALRASGQKGTPVWKQLLSSVVSWQTALVVGITLLSVYGRDIADWVGGLLGADSAQRKLNASVAEFNKTAIQGQAEARLLFEAVKDTEEGTRGRAEAIRRINDQYGKYLPHLLTERSSLMELGEAYRTVTSAILENTAAKTRAKAIEEIAGGSIERQADALARMREMADKALGADKGSSAMSTVMSLADDLLGNGYSAGDAMRGVGAKLQHDYGARSLPGEFYGLLEDYVEGVSDANRKIEAIQKRYNPFFNQEQADEAVTRNKAYWEEIKRQSRSFLESLPADRKRLLDEGNTGGIDKATVERYREAKRSMDEAAAALKAYDSYERQDKDNDRIDRETRKRVEAAWEVARAGREASLDQEEFEIEMRQRRLDLDADSYAKRTAQARIAYDADLLAVKRFEEEQLRIQRDTEREAWKAGGGKGVFRPSDELPGEIKARAEEMRAAAKETYERTVREIARDMDAELATERTRLSGELDARLHDINAYYDERVRAARGNNRLIAQIEENRRKEIRRETSRHEEEMIQLHARAARERIEMETRAYLLESDQREAILKVERDAARERLRILRSLQEVAPTDDLAEEIAEAERALEGLNRQIDAIPADRVMEMLGMARRVFGELGGLGGEAGALFGGLAGQVDNVMTAFDKSATRMDRISAGISGLVSLIDMMASASSRRKEAEREFYKNAIAMAHEYALALNEQVRLRHEASGGGFVTDYAGRITDGYKAMADARVKYEEAVKKLSEGRAKTGLRNAVDWGNVGKGVGAGAALGASVGSVIPVIGTAAGAIVGAAVGFFTGLFGGRKKKNKTRGLLEVFPELVDGAGNLNRELAESIVKTDQVDDKTKQLIQDALDWADAIDEARKQIKEIVTDLAGDLGGDMKTAILDAWKAGEDAAGRMFGAAGKSLEGFVQDMLYSTVFSDVFDRFSERLAESLDPVNGDGDVVDDYDWLTRQMDERDERYVAMLEAIKRRASERGFELWGDDTKQEGRQAKAKGLSASISQDSADELNGNFYALLIYADKTSQGVTGIQDSLIRGITLLERIARNTDRLETVETEIVTTRRLFQEVVNNGLTLRR